MARLLQIVLRLGADCYGLAAACPAPLWSALRVIAQEPARWPSAAAARSAATGRVLGGLWRLSPDGMALPMEQGDDGAALCARWSAPRCREAHEASGPSPAPAAWADEAASSASGAAPAAAAVGALVSSSDLGSASRLGGRPGEETAYPDGLLWPAPPTRLQ